MSPMPARPWWLTREQYQQDQRRAAMQLQQSPWQDLHCQRQAWETRHKVHARERVQGNLLAEHNYGSVTVPEGYEFAPPPPAI